jgi:NADPH2:quinone reductase
MRSERFLFRTRRVSPVESGPTSITPAKERKPIAMSIPATMRALRQTSLNGPQDLRLITGAPVPVPGPGEVLVRVTAAGVNFGDIAQSRGTFPGGPQPPYVAGFEVAGEVVATGEEVTGLEAGARVIGAGIGCGAFAEYTALPAAAVTMAKHYGATVIATASPGKHATVRALGADHVLDSSGDGLAAEVLRLTGGTGADLVLESAGGETFRASLTAAKRVAGRVIVYGAAGGAAPVTNWELIYKHQVHLIGLNIRPVRPAAGSRGLPGSGRDRGDLAAARAGRAGDPGLR